MTAMPYRTTTQRQSLKTMAQTERAANQGPTKLRLEYYIYAFMKFENNEHFFRNLLRQKFVIFSNIIISNIFFVSANFVSEGKPFISEPAPLQRLHKKPSVLASA